MITRSTVPGVEARVGHRRDDRLTLVAAHARDLVRDALADARLDEDAAGRRLDQQAVECLEQSMLVVDLVRDEGVPEDPRHGPEERPGVAAERSRLDQGDASPAARGQPTSRPRRSASVARRGFRAAAGDPPPAFRLIRTPTGRMCSALNCRSTSRFGRPSFTSNGNGRAGQGPTRFEGAKALLGRPAGLSEPFLAVREVAVERRGGRLDWPWYFDPAPGCRTAARPRSTS